MGNKFTRERLNNYKDGDEFVTHACHYGAEVVRTTGSHRMVKNKKGLVSIPLHKDLPIGTRQSIIKDMIKFGMAIAGLIALYNLPQIVAWIGAH